MAENDDVKKEKKLPSRSRKWQFTINNPADHGYPHEVIREKLQYIENLDYWCMCDEIGGKTNCYHTHVFIMRKNSGIRFDFMKKLFPPAHFERCDGTAQENRNYVRKEGKYEGSEKELTNLPETFEEYGECPQEEQGKRNDLIQLYGMIKDGLSNYEILEQNPRYLEKLDRIDSVREMLLEEKYKNVLRDMHVEYWYGVPGTGKTSGVYALYPNLADVYRIYDPKNPWDTYRGQDVVVFDDFHSGMFLLPVLLNWITGYPATLRSRYRQKTACFTKVYIISNLPLDDQYTHYQREDRTTWLAFLRRIHKVKYFGSNGEIVEYESVDAYMHREDRFQNANCFIADMSKPGITQESFVDKNGYMTLSDDEMQKIEDMFGTGGN